MRIENRLQRAQSRARTKNVFGGDNQTSVEDQLTRLEDDIRRLKIEFDIYFNGASKRPPYDTKGRVETILKRLGDDRSLSFAERYRFNTLMARYNAFRDLWRRTMQGREEGKDPVSAARATAKREAVESFSKTTLVCEDASREVETVKNLYDALVDAKTKCGESTDDFSFPRFHRLIASKADSLKARLKCERVSFSVDVEGGHVSFKARAERD
ncbi:MAG: MXAN_5187 C-terminal domain-containing protein [Pyrinomonadaceae bacterium]